ncbi:diguanylate cyclase [uncultured Psychrosphaera sp.]|uniref:sensor domain-containing diguanylate cyclase n=1 Tax=uncultured Psychrosphaera sp. TaxID=1403522 RepID=UPI0030F7ED1D
MFNKFVIFLLIFVELLLQVNAATYDISNLQGKTDLTPYIEYNIGDHDPLEAPPIEGWSQFTYSQIKLGFDNRVQWFRFELANPSAQVESYYIELDAPLLDNITFYILSQGRVRSVQSLGDNQVFPLRPVLHESFIIPISLHASETLEIYIATQTSGSTQLPITLWQKEYFQEQQNYQRLLTGSFIGLIVAAIIACLITFSVSREKSSLLNAGFIVSFLMIILTLNGFAFHYFWPNQPVLQQHAFYIFTCLSILFSALLARETLKHFYQDHQLMSWFKYIALFAVLLLPATLYLSYQAGLYLIILISIIICICHLYAGVMAWNHGLHEHQEFNYGLAVLLICLLLICVNNFSPFSLPISNLNLLQLSLIIHILFLAIAVTRSSAIEYDVFGNDEETTDQALLHSEQMMELQFALRELEEKNQQLEKLNTIDALSGIYNRRHFDKRLQAELRRGRRELTPLSLILFDIDHFKKVNDTYGHIVGDEVIRCISMCASEQLSRTADEVFRYGGEEFAVLLPNTNLPGALTLAEKIRAAIENLTITLNEQTLSCKISLGVATHDSTKAIEPNSFIEMADSALYKAKQSGRNQVQTYQEVI